MSRRISIPLAAVLSILTFVAINTHASPLDNPERSLAVSGDEAVAAGPTPTYFIDGPTRWLPGQDSAIMVNVPTPDSEIVFAVPTPGSDMFYAVPTLTLTIEGPVRWLPISGEEFLLAGTTPIACIGESLRFLLRPLPSSGTLSTDEANRLLSAIDIRAAYLMFFNASITVRSAPQLLDDGQVAVELEGIEDEPAVGRILSETGFLELIDASEVTPSAGAPVFTDLADAPVTIAGSVAGTPPPGTTVFHTVVDGRAVTDAYFDFGTDGRNTLVIVLNPDGSAQLAAQTGGASEYPLAVVIDKTVTGTRTTTELEDGIASIIVEGLDDDTIEIRAAEMLAGFLPFPVEIATVEPLTRVGCD